MSVPLKTILKGKEKKSFKAYFTCQDYIHAESKERKEPEEIDYGNSNFNFSLDTEMLNRVYSFFCDSQTVSVRSNFFFLPGNLITNNQTCLPLL